ncbi:hypothetical protein MRX96_042168 [Rhipicephalus microplus]
MAPQPTNALRASSSLCGGMHQTGATGCAGRLPKQIKSGYPHGFKPKTEEKHKQARAPKSSPKKAAKPEPKKSQAGLSTNVVWHPPIRGLLYPRSRISHPLYPLNYR